MDIKKVIEINSNIRKARDKEIERLKTISEYMQDIMRECPHNVVVKIRNNHPRMIHVDGTYYCPACDMMLFNLPSYKKLADTPFKDSKVLNLAELSLLCDKDTLDTIKTEIVTNYDEYLNDQNSDNLKELLKSMEYDYDRSSCQMKRVLK